MNSVKQLELSNSHLALALGVPTSIVDLWKAAGMPTNSYESA